MSQGLSRRAFLPLAGAMMIPPVAKAQGFPKRPISLVVPYPAGGSLDPVARTIAHELSVRQGWSVVVENMAGGAATIGTRYVARAEPDGHVLLLGSNQTHGSNPGLLKEVGYDPVRDFAPIAGIGDLQHLLVVRKGLGAGRLRASPTRKGSREVSGGSAAGWQFFTKLFVCGSGMSSFNSSCCRLGRLLIHRRTGRSCLLPRGGCAPPAPLERHSGAGCRFGATLPSTASIAAAWRRRCRQRRGGWLDRAVRAGTNADRCAVDAVRGGSCHCWRSQGG